MGKGGGTSTTTVTTPPPTEEERQLTLRQLDLADLQLTELRKQSALQESLAGPTRELFDLQTQLLKEAVAADKATNEQLERQRVEDEKLRPIQEELLNKQLEILRAGGAATPEQTALIERATEQGIAGGKSDIEAFQTEAIQRIRDELAPSLGLRPTDTPVIDRAGLVAKEATRQFGRLTTDLRASEAAAKLDYPLNANKVTSDIAGFQQGLGLERERLSAALRDAAMANRLRLAGGLGEGRFATGNLGLGLVAAANPNLAATSYALSQSRLANRTTTATTSGGGLGIAQVGQIAGGVGALLTGAAAFSSRAIKDAVGQVDAAAILDAVAALPVARWHYKADWKGAEVARPLHLGPYAEDFQAAFGVGNGREIDFIDAIGALFAAVGELARRAKAQDAPGMPAGGFDHAPATISREMAHAAAQASQGGA